MRETAPYNLSAGSTSWATFLYRSAGSQEAAKHTDDLALEYNIRKSAGPITTGLAQWMLRWDLAWQSTRGVGKWHCEKSNGAHARYLPRERSAS